MWNVKPIWKSLRLWGIVATEKKVNIDRLNQTLNRFFSSVSIAVSLQELCLAMCQKHSWWRNCLQNLDSSHNNETEILKSRYQSQYWSWKYYSRSWLPKSCLAHHFFTQFEVFSDLQHPLWMTPSPHWSVTLSPMRPVTRVVLIRLLICLEMDSWISASGFKETLRRPLSCDVTFSALFL